MLQFRARHDTVNATPLAVLDAAGKPTDERSYLVQINGTRALIDAETFEARYQATETNGHNGRKVRAKRGRPPAAAVKTSRRKTNRRPRGETQERILATLRSHGSLTTAELSKYVAEQLDIGSASVYQTMRRMEGQGIERREDDASHLDKWFLKGARQ